MERSSYVMVLCLLEYTVYEYLSHLPLLKARATTQGPLRVNAERFRVRSILETDDETLSSFRGHIYRFQTIYLTNFNMLPV